ncbi:O-antigen ligase family protein [Metabacillus halosaccharovorans]|uniref:O-antigen ligase family protein n=1 Tax=Metabacillus halosaccharovorans TaxID=930124 RepID=A0ABT3DCA3_9BACI|nr:O-antigen ligase family protein [Metabacillus halosaccharovorans]MCV9884483.1 O-antigen ligase family protein [Metabacillus halosaccharovorans]
MIRLLVYLTAFLYCFVWLRLPDIAGIDFPLQRLVAWFSVVAVFINISLRKKFLAGPFAKRFILFVFIFLLNMVINLLWNYKNPSFGFIYYLMDFSKYIAAFAVAYLMYFALKKKIVSIDKINKYLKWSTSLAILLTFLSLALYIIGFRTDNEILLRTWGSAWGVIPTGGFFPRLAGTTSEPQQFSIIYLTPVLLLLAINKGKLTLIPILGIVALLLSQSKFSLLTVVVIFAFSFLLNKKGRMFYLIAGVCALPFVINTIMKLPVFSRTLEQGSNSLALQERFENAFIMTNIIKNEFLFGIGAGQYGTYRSLILPVEFNPSYYPNNDYLKVFSELGLLGFLVLIWFFISVTVFSIKSYKKMDADKRHLFLAVCIGTLVIALNMIIGYELLHIFFWINLGILFYMGENYPRELNTEIRT